MEGGREKGREGEREGRGGGGEGGREGGGRGMITCEHPMEGIKMTCEHPIQGTLAPYTRHQALSMSYTKRLMSYVKCSKLRPHTNSEKVT